MSNPASTNQSVISDQIEALFQQLTSYTTETTESFRQKRRIVAEILGFGANLTDTQRTRAEAKSQEVVQQFDAFRARYGALTTARQLSIVSAEVVALQKLTNDGITVDSEGQLVAQELSDKLDALIKQLARTASEYALQAETATKNAINYVSLEQVAQAQQHYDHATAVFSLSSVEADLPIELDPDAPETRGAITGIRNLLNDNGRVIEIRSEYRNRTAELQQIKLQLEAALPDYEKATAAYERGDYRAALDAADDAQACVWQIRDQGGNQPRESEQIRFRAERAAAKLGATLVPEIERLLEKAATALSLGAYNDADNHLHQVENRLGPLAKADVAEKVSQRHDNLRNQIKQRGIQDDAVISQIKNGMIKNRSFDYNQAITELLELVAERSDYAPATTQLDRLLEISSDKLIEQAANGGSLSERSQQALLDAITEQTERVGSHSSRATRERIRTDLREAYYELGEHRRATQAIEQQRARYEMTLAQARNVYQSGDAAKALQLLDTLKPHLGEAEDDIQARVQNARSEYGSLLAEQFRAAAQTALQAQIPDIAAARLQLARVADIVGEADDLYINLERRIDIADCKYQANQAYAAGRFDEAYQQWHGAKLRSTDPAFERYRKARQSYAKQLYDADKSESLAEMLRGAPNPSNQESEWLREVGIKLTIQAEQRRQQEAEQAQERERLQATLQQIARNWNEKRTDPEVSVAREQAQLFELKDDYRGKGIPVPDQLRDISERMANDQEQRRQAAKLQQELEVLVAQEEQPIDEFVAQFRATFERLARLEDKIGEVDQQLAALAGTTSTLEWSRRNPRRNATLQLLIERNNKLVARLLADRTIGYDRISEHSRLLRLINSLDPRGDANIRITKLSEQS